MSKAVTMNVGNDGIAVLTLDVQGKPMNVITPELQQDLRECVEKVVSDEAIIGAVVTSAKNDFMAGPFLNYIIQDTLNQRNIVLEGLVFSPSSKKREQIFELEAIFKSLKIYKAKK